mmetsp:Transcript_24097/g.56062  ORF Transcript_24097/g.56062 Transcript_24097/m.56062 type:complete len:675 (+) Transcript_24097:28-2052(+)
MSSTNLFERCLDPCHVPDPAFYGRENIRIGLCSPGDDCSCNSSMWCSDSGYCWGTANPCLDYSGQIPGEEVTPSSLGYTCCANTVRRAGEGDFYTSGSLLDCLRICNQAADCAGVEWYEQYLGAKPCLVVTEWETSSSTSQVADQTCVQDGFAASVNSNSVTESTRICGLRVPLRVESATAGNGSTTVAPSDTTVVLVAPDEGGSSMAGTELSPPMIALLVVSLMIVAGLLVGYGYWRHKKKREPVIHRHHKTDKQTAPPPVPTVVRDPVHAFKLDDEHMRHPDVFKAKSAKIKAVEAQRKAAREPGAEQAVPPEPIDAEAQLPDGNRPLPHQAAHGVSSVEKRPPAWANPKDAFKTAVSAKFGKKGDEVTAIRTGFKEAATTPPEDDLMEVDLDDEELEEGNGRTLQGSMEEVAVMRENAQNAYAALGLERLRVRSDLVGVTAVAGTPTHKGSSDSPRTSHFETLELREISAPLAESQFGLFQYPMKQRDASAPIHIRGDHDWADTSPQLGGLRGAATPSLHGGATPIIRGGVTPSLRGAATPSPKDAWGSLMSPGGVSMGSPLSPFNPNNEASMTALTIMSIADRMADKGLVDLRELTAEFKGGAQEAFMESVMKMNRRTGRGLLITLEELSDVLDRCATGRPHMEESTHGASPSPPLERRIDIHHPSYYMS